MFLSKANYFGLPKARALGQPAAVYNIFLYVTRQERLQGHTGVLDYVKITIFLSLFSPFS